VKISQSLKASWRSARTFFRPKEVKLGMIRLRIDPNMMPDSMIRAIFRGSYEFGERAAVERMVKPGDRVVEFGGGIGAVSLTAAHIAGAGAVSVLEPQPQACELIRSNAALNQIQLNCENAAVAPEAGVREFFQSTNMISSSLIDRGASHKHVRTVREVRTVALRDIIKTAPSVMIVDIEGAEIELLQSAQLDPVQVVIIEMHPNIVGAEAVAALDIAFHAKGLVGIPHLRHADTYVYSRNRQPTQ
jgi:FkbM family methyltransferase